MPIMAIYRSKDVDEETFNRYRLEVPMDPIPEGAISHHIGFDADGLIGFDVWETEAQMKAFHEERVSPGLLRVGLPADPPMVVTLHALWTAADAPRHNVFVPAPKIETT